MERPDREPRDDSPSCEMCWIILCLLIPAGLIVAVLWFLVLTN
jgi:hypothetical protein